MSRRSLKTLSSMRNGLLSSPLWLCRAAQERRTGELAGDVVALRAEAAARAAAAQAAEGRARLLDLDKQRLVAALELERLIK
jgi:hypothetical protein